MGMYCSAQQAVKLIKSGDNVYVHGVTSAPMTLLEAMAKRHSELRGVNVYSALIFGKPSYPAEEYKESFTVRSLFVSEGVRSAVAGGYGYAIPGQLSDIPGFLREGLIPVDVILLNVSPPDKHGYCSMGTSLDITVSAYECAKIRIAQINPNVPRVFGDGQMHISEFDAVVEVNDPVIEVPSILSSAEDEMIGKFIAERIPDGATLQIGVGGIPNAVLRALGSHKNMGVHTEAIVEEMLPLIESGAIDNSRKGMHDGLSVGSLVLGSRKLYDFVDNNPKVLMKDCAYTNNPMHIAQNKKMRSVNAAIEVDLTGQVCADSIGTRIFSGIGGQNDFMYGSTLSEGGTNFIALTSMTAKGKSKITPFLAPGAGVTTNRYIIHNVVTEYGVAELRAKSYAERTRALIDIAHPSVREELEREAVSRYGLSFLRLRG
ncbi:MAG: acetyl-CoA hydrolase/transferase C-terminal domain-containing protein [Rikenellaceae bacterium]